MKRPQPGWLILAVVCRGAIGGAVSAEPLSDEVMIPVREVARWAGASVEWNSPEVLVTKGETQVSLRTHEGTYWMTNSSADHLSPAWVMVDDVAYVRAKQLLATLKAAVDVSAGVSTVNCRIGDEVTEWPIRRTMAHPQTRPNYVDSPHGGVPHGWRVFSLDGRWCLRGCDCTYYYSGEVPRAPYVVEDRYVCLLDQKTSWIVALLPGWWPLKGACWRPDSRYFALMEHGGNQVWVYDTKAQPVRRYEIAKHHHRMRFSSDGKHLVFPGARITLGLQ